MPMYPAAMSALHPTTIPTRWQPIRIVAAVLCFVALVLVVASVFLPLYSGEVSFGGGLSGSDNSVEITYSPWSVEFSPTEPGADLVDVPHVGYPLVFAAVFLAGAVCACWYAATPSAGRSAGRAAGVLTVAGIAFLIGATWTIATLVTNGVEYFITLGSLGQGVESDGHYLAGYWLLLTAALLGFAGAVLSLLPARRQAFWPGPQQVDPYQATPPYGIAAASAGRAVAYALPPEPVRGPVPAVDPLTGQSFGQGPMSAPGGFPAAVDPLTGQSFGQGPASAPGGFPAAVDPLTGQPFGQGPASAPGGLPAAVDPLTGQPLPSAVSSPPNGLPAGPAGAADPAVPFTSDPVGQADGAHPAPAADHPPATEPPPITLPDAPPPPPSPPGPAVPPTEDPLAEPPRT
ncbi:hypothetical protein [Actinophytocola sp.]|uniref:hypothetical protein n=1 Tax=Actinophytocola sp. TaxID=1872138 RepID=UPI00389A33C1